MERRRFVLKHHQHRAQGGAVYIWQPLHTNTRQRGEDAAHSRAPRRGGAVFGAELASEDTAGGLFPRKPITRCQMGGLSGDTSIVTSWHCSRDMDTEFHTDCQSNLTFMSHLHVSPT